ncbi:thioredoxin family protein [Sciscionella sediminilitoris]|uniref:thioredoxin family protein n=1 Tax=Sciscionella sediminilitoris TaxID=1445613 RepID=UPI0004DEE837|nr:thioredoxin family protein [Sciscionella sp. SE31]
MTGVWVLLGAVVLAVLAGALLRARSGKVRAARTATVPEAVRELLDETGVTLVQISTEFCADCRRARSTLERFAEENDSVRHVELDVTDRPELATALRVTSTPTTLAVDPRGAELFRFSGLPVPETLREQCARQFA